MKNLFCLTTLFLLLGFSNMTKAQTSTMKAQNNTAENGTLNAKQQSIVTISTFTAKGDLKKLHKALNVGLDSGLTVNEIKEVLVQLYAYCGFPRSLQAINTLISILEERKAKGIKDVVGKEATPVSGNESKYERGKKILESLTGQPEREPKTGYAAFSPEIDVFLKEHLFADIFSRDVLSYTDREIATISALIALGGVEPMMQGHMAIGLNVGLSESGLKQILSIIESNVGKKEADAGRTGLSVVIAGSRSAGGVPAASVQNSQAIKITRSGSQAPRQGPAENFTGSVRVDTPFQASVPGRTSGGRVTFEPGARTAWHTHPLGQTLIVTAGVGRVQGWGGPVEEIRQGDVVWIPPGVKHWHGASPTTVMTHIAIAEQLEGKAVDWMEKVSDEQYGAPAQGQGIGGSHRP